MQHKRIARGEPAFNPLRRATVPTSAPEQLKQTTHLPCSLSDFRSLLPLGAALSYAQTQDSKT
jgi:hypothetical protein